MSKLVVFLKAQAGGAGRLSDDLGNLGAPRGEKLKAAQAILERGEARDLAAARVEVCPDRADDDYRAAPGAGAEEANERFAGGRSRRCRKELLHLVDGDHQARLCGE